MNAKPSKYQSRCCDECGGEYTPRRKDEFFCSTPCRKEFENRRMVRGAELYDLFCGYRRERPLAKELGIWTEMCRLEQRWREEDETQRAGRRSYRPLRRALQKLKDTGRLNIGLVVGIDMTGKRSGNKR